MNNEFNGKKKKKSTKLWHWVCLITSKFCYIKKFLGKFLQNNYFGVLIQCFPSTTFNKSYRDRISRLQLNKIILKTKKLFKPKKGILYGNQYFCSRLSLPEKE